MKKWLLSIFILFLSACSALPPVMRDAPYTNIDLNAVNSNLAAYSEKPFRWGGTIINVANTEHSSQAQLLFYPLNTFGRPSIDRETEGRFSISSDQFLDPAIFTKGTEITVTGTLSGEIKQKVGEKTLTIPLLRVEHIHLWPKRQSYDRRYYNHYPYFLNHPHYFYHPRFRYNFYID